MDSFMHNHQSALDSQREDDAIQYLQDSGVYPDPYEENYPSETDDDYEPTDDEVMSSFGTKWHDRL
tara:strand:+ start:425 stop:622 length:198 start_codon:yes stop_codon:yes gene_type:complete